MRKMLALSAMLAVALAMAPGKTDPGDGCQFIGGNTPDGGTCTYTATGPASYVAATPNGWTVTAIRDGEPVELMDTSSLSLPSAGDIATQAGDEVTVTIGPDCAGPACGWVGVLVIAETA